MDPDPAQNPDPAIFVTNLQDANKKIIFSASYFSKVPTLHSHHFSKIKSHKGVTKQYLGIKVLLSLFLLDVRRIQIRIQDPVRNAAQKMTKNVQNPSQCHLDPKHF